MPSRPAAWRPSGQRRPARRRAGDVAEPGRAETGVCASVTQTPLKRVGAAAGPLRARVGPPLVLQSSDMDASPLTGVVAIEGEQWRFVGRGGAAFCALRAPAERRFGGGRFSR